MNYISRTFIVLLLSVVGYSCGDFLDEEPRDEASIEQFFSEPSHAQTAVNGLYRYGAPSLYLNGGVYSGKQAMYGPYLSGFFDNEYKGQEPHIQFAQQLTLNGLNSDGFLNDMWSTMYGAISRANNAILYIPGTPGLSDDESNRLLAEARFFRAFAYFTLTRLFGEVPLVTEPYESLDNLYVQRNALSDTYDLMVEDLRFAVDQGGLAENTMQGNGYQLTRGVAATLLADVYLTMSGFPLGQDRYADAAAAARLVINEGSHALAQHDFLPSGEIDLANSAYNKMRRDEAFEEFVYPIEFFVGIDDSDYPRWTYPVTLVNEVAYDITNGAYQPQPEFMRGYDPVNDLRAQNKQYFHTSMTKEDGSELTFPPTPYIWHDDEALLETANSGKDARAYGYSEVLLIAAEGIARSEGVTTEAVDYLTQVRSRAYWQQDAATISQELSGLSAEAFVEEVWKERYRELVFDFKLWYDMVRTRTYPLSSDDGSGDIQFVPLVGQENTWGQTFQERHLLLPLPDRELQRNPELDQNTGY